MLNWYEIQKIEDSKLTGGAFVFVNAMIKKILQNRTKIIGAFEENGSRIMAF